jgi:nitrogen regulatory protein PII
VAKMLVLITAQAESAREIGAGWKAAGAPGVTFIEGYGLQSLRMAADSMEILSGTTSMLEILRQTTVNVVIAMAVLEEEAPIPAMLDVVERILGDMQQPNKGLVFVMDIEQALGISHFRGKPS